MKRKIYEVIRRSSRGRKSSWKTFISCTKSVYPFLQSVYNAEAAPSVCAICLATGSRSSLSLFLSSSRSLSLSARDINFLIFDRSCRLKWGSFLGTKWLLPFSADILRSIQCNVCDRFISLLRLCRPGLCRPGPPRALLLALNFFYATVRPPEKRACVRQLLPWFCAPFFRYYSPHEKPLFLLATNDHVVAERTVRFNSSPSDHDFHVPSTLSLYDEKKL